MAMARTGDFYYCQRVFAMTGEKIHTGCRSHDFLNNDDDGGVSNSYFRRKFVVSLTQICERCTCIRIFDFKMTVVRAKPLNLTIRKGSGYDYTLNK